MPVVLKYWSLIILEPSVPIHACTGITLPLPLPVISKVVSAKLLFSFYMLVQTKYFGFLRSNFSFFRACFKWDKKYRSRDTQKQVGQRFVERFCGVSESDSSSPVFMSLCVCVSSSACSNSPSTERLFVKFCAGGTY